MPVRCSIRIRHTKKTSGAASAAVGGFEHDLPLQARGAADFLRLYFSAQAIAAILQVCNSASALREGIEITLDTNPGTAEAESLSVFRAAGESSIHWRAKFSENHFGSPWAHPQRR